MKKYFLIFLFFFNTTHSQAENSFSTVCHIGCDFLDLSKAIQAAKPDGTIYIKAEEFKTCGLINKSLKIIGEIRGETRPHLKETSCNGKGALIIEAENVEISNIEISDINVPDQNGACIRIGPAAKNVILKNIYCHDSQNGILANYSHKGTISVLDSVIERCGAGGRSHGAYIQTDGDIVFKNVKILSTKGVGHSLKLSADNILIENSIISALNGVNSRAIDLFGGGVLVVRNSILQQGPMSDNRDMIGLAFEKNRRRTSKHSVLLENNWIIFDQHTELLSILSFNRGYLFAGNKLGNIIVRNNKIVAMLAINIEGVIKNNQIFSNREEAGLLEYNGEMSSLPFLPGSSF